MGTGSTWQLGVRRLNSEQEVVSSGKHEAWTLSCESADGKTVYETRDVFIDRGERTSLNLRCGGKKVKKKSVESKRAKVKAAKAKRAACVAKAKKLEEGQEAEGSQEELRAHLRPPAAPDPLELARGPMPGRGWRTRSAPRSARR